MFSLCDFELILWAFSVVLSTLREIMKQCCNNDMDQLSFCTFLTKHGPQMEQKQTIVLKRLPIYQVRFRVGFPVGYRVGFSSWIFELDFLAGFSWRDFQ